MQRLIYLGASPKINYTLEKWAYTDISAVII